MKQETIVPDEPKKSRRRLTHEELLEKAAAMELRAKALKDRPTTRIIEMLEGLQAPSGDVREILTEAVAKLRRLIA